jgi:hypothetical protein
MALFDEIDKLITRANDPAKVSAAAIKDRVVLYSNGLKSKARQASYALDVLCDLSKTDPRGSATGGFSSSDQVHFFSDSFWAFSRSMLDVMAQIVNQALALGLDERYCDFESTLRVLLTHHAGSPVTTSLDAAKNAAFYTQLNDYRNCSLHRRQVYLRCEQSATVYTTPGYDTATIPVAAPEWYICDNPLDVSPIVASHRRLNDYPRSVYADLSNHIEQILVTLIP